MFRTRFEIGRPPRTSERPPVVFFPGAVPTTRQLHGARLARVRRRGTMGGPALGSLTFGGCLGKTGEASVRARCGAQAAPPITLVSLSFAGCLCCGSCNVREVVGMHAATSWACLRWPNVSRRGHSNLKPQSSGADRRSTGRRPPRPEAPSRCRPWRRRGQTADSPANMDSQSHKALGEHAANAPHDLKANGRSIRSEWKYRFSRNQWTAPSVRPRPRSVFPKKYPVYQRILSSRLAQVRVLSIPREIALCCDLPRVSPTFQHRSGMPFRPVRRAQSPTIVPSALLCLPNRRCVDRPIGWRLWTADTLVPSRLGENFWSHQS